jgi:hypothetical protein
MIVGDVSKPMSEMCMKIIAMAVYLGLKKGGVLSPCGSQSCQPSRVEGEHQSLKVFFPKSR